MSLGIERTKEDLSRAIGDNFNRRSKQNGRVAYVDLIDALLEELERCGAVHFHKSARHRAIEATQASD
jgi:hypothetical protein